jgi:uncharacterized protein
MPCGVYRCVVFVGTYAVKFPRVRNLREGMQCNRWEREMWRVWQPILRWETLCPVLFADPLGLVVVMPRADQAGVTFIDVLLKPDYYPETSGEFKASDCGRVDGRVVTFDYGLSDKEMVTQYRNRYKALNKPAEVMRPSVAELRPAAEALHGWAASKPFLRRLWIFGSRARGTARSDSDLDVAIEIDPVGNDENAYTSFVGDAGSWRNELQPLLTYELHLKWYDKSNRPVWNGVNSDGIQVYERVDVAC